MILFFRLLITQKKIAPIVMHTGFGSEEIAVQALHKGAIDHISKDRLSKDRLGGTIKATLEAEAGGRRIKAEKKYLFIYDDI